MGEHRVVPSALHHIFRGPFIVPLFANSRSVMIKYLVGWLLGVPVVVLVIIYLFMH